jgi:hypothetical protein
VKGQGLDPVPASDNRLDSLLGGKSEDQNLVESKDPALELEPEPVQG